MISRRIVLTSSFAVAVLMSPFALAADKKPFTAGAFDEAAKAGKSILVEVTAPWCPTCTKQKPILSELQSDAKFKNLAVFTVDFDSQKDALRKLNVQMQSTLIAYKGGKEAARSTGVTDRAEIAKLLNSAI
jgi:thiol-disulfide isomerase/thioredoxin